MVAGPGPVRVILAGRRAGGVCQFDQRESSLSLCNPSFNRAHAGPLSDPGYYGASSGRAALFGAPGGGAGGLAGGFAAAVAAPRPKMATIANGGCSLHLRASGRSHALPAAVCTGLWAGSTRALICSKSLLRGAQYRGTTRSADA